MIDPQDPIPEWAKALVTLVLGAGGGKLFSVWLENRRLSNKDYRETLLERVRELESVVSSLQLRVGNLRVEMAHLEERLADESELVERLRNENDELRARLQDAVERNLADEQDLH